jgi:hypothetical protein
MRAKVSRAWDGDDFAKAFAADVDATEAHVMAVVQKPLGIAPFTGESGPPAWKTVPFCYTVATNDQMISAAGQFWVSASREARVDPWRSDPKANGPRSVATLVSRLWRECSPSSTPMPTGGTFPPSKRHPNAACSASGHASGSITPLRLRMHAIRCAPRAASVSPFQYSKSSVSRDCVISRRVIRIVI